MSQLQNNYVDTGLSNIRSLMNGLGLESMLGVNEAFCLNKAVEAEGAGSPQHIIDWWLELGQIMSIRHRRNTQDT